jgi:hypothetical protein
MEPAITEHELGLNQHVEEINLARSIATLASRQVLIGPANGFESPDMFGLDLCP